MTIEEARKKIDELDQQIVDLFYERMNTSCEIAKVKAAEGLDIYNPVREREILDKLAAQHEAGEDPRADRAAARAQGTGPAGARDRGLPGRGRCLCADGGGPAL